MLLPSLYAVVVFGLVVLMTDLLGYAELIVNRGLGIGAVAQIAGLQLVPTLARTLPFAVLLGILVGLGRLLQDLLEVVEGGAIEVGDPRPLAGIIHREPLPGLVVGSVGRLQRQVEALLHEPALDRSPEIESFAHRACGGEHLVDRQSDGLHGGAPGCAAEAARVQALTACDDDRARAGSRARSPAASGAATTRRAPPAGSRP